MACNSAEVATDSAWCQLKPVLHHPCLSQHVGALGARHRFPVEGAENVAELVLQALRGVACRRTKNQACACSMPRSTQPARATRALPVPTPTVPLSPSHRTVPVHPPSADTGLVLAAAWTRMRMSLSSGCGCLYPANLTLGSRSSSLQRGSRWRRRQVAVTARPAPCGARRTGTGAVAPHMRNKLPIVWSSRATRKVAALGTFSSGMRAILQA